MLISTPQDLYCLTPTPKFCPLEMELQTESVLVHMLKKSSFLIYMKKSFAVLVQKRVNLT